MKQKNKALILNEPISKYILFFCLDAKETKNQDPASSATCYSSIPKSKELAALKQLLILRNLRNAGARLPDAKAMTTNNYYLIYNYVSQVIDLESETFLLLGCVNDKKLYICTLKN